MITDPIGDMLTRIRNAMAVKQPEVRVPKSNLRTAVLKVLKDEGFIEDFHLSRKPPRPHIKVRLKYAERAPVIRGLRRVSRPGRRVYRGVKDIVPVKGGLGIAVVSTSHGVMSDYRCRAQMLGGEVLCEVW